MYYSVVPPRSSLVSVWYRLVLSVASMTFVVVASVMLVVVSVSSESR